MNFTEVVNQVAQQTYEASPFLIMGGVLWELLKRFVLPRLLPNWFQDAATGAGGFLRSLREKVAAALEIARRIPGVQPDEWLQRILNAIDAILVLPGIEHRSPAEARSLLEERLKL